jgi:hypothetical protein
MSAPKRQEPDWVGEAKRMAFNDPELGMVEASAWYDARLKQAYALIDEVLDSYDLTDRADVARQLTRASEAVENADLALEIIA